MFFLRYIAAYIAYRKEKAQLSQKHRTNRRFLYQAMFSALPCLMFINCYHFNIATLELLLAEICAMVNPFVYLWFNSELRKDFLEIVRVKKIFGRSSVSNMDTSPYVISD
jgi:tryptophan-rich sensory protein